MVLFCHSLAGRSSRGLLFTLMESDNSFLSDNTIGPRSYMARHKNTALRRLYSICLFIALFYYDACHPNKSATSIMSIQPTL